MTTETRQSAAPASPGMRPIYLDDLTVGDQFKSGEHAMDEAQITAFAAQFDPQPFHLDDAAARSTLFGGLAASGNRVYATSGYGELVALDAGSGAVVWRQRFDSPVTGAPFAIAAPVSPLRNSPAPRAASIRRITMPTMAVPTTQASVGHSPIRPPITTNRPISISGQARKSKIRGILGPLTKASLRQGLLAAG